jgi:hypothetical protein
LRELTGNICVAVIYYLISPSRTSQAARPAHPEACCGASADRA